MASKNLSCEGCLNIITAREYLRCTSCGSNYDLQCAGTEKRLYNKMTKEQKSNWNCDSCRCKQPKSDNSNTPIRPVPLLVSTKSPESEESSAKNVTQHKKQQRMESKQRSPTHSSGQEYLLSSEVRAEIYSAVSEAVKTAIKSYIEGELQLIKDEIVVLKEYKSSLDYLSADYDQIKSDLKANGEIIIKLTKDNERLSKVVSEQSTRLALMEQYSRESNIEINGIPEHKSENLPSTIKQLSAVISCPLQDTQILNCVRVRKLNESSNRPRSVIVKLPSARVRDNVIAAVINFNKRNKNEKLNTKHLGYGDTKNAVYVSEHISPYLKALHAETRKIAKEKEVKYVWIRNGRIFCRKDDTYPAINIKSYDCLTKL